MFALMQKRAKYFVALDKCTYDNIVKVKTNIIS